MQPITQGREQVHLCRHVDAVLLTLLLFTETQPLAVSKRSCTGVYCRLNSLLYHLVQTTIPEQ